MINIPWSHNLSIDIISAISLQLPGSLTNSYDKSKFHYHYKQYCLFIPARNHYQRQLIITPKIVEQLYV